MHSLRRLVVGYLPEWVYATRLERGPGAVDTGVLVGPPDRACREASEAFNHLDDGMRA